MMSGEIKMSFIANEYGFYEQSEIDNNINEDINHFIKKHGYIPNTVFIKDPNLFGNKEYIVFRFMDNDFNIMISVINTDPPMTYALAYIGKKP